MDVTTVTPERKWPRTVRMASGLTSPGRSLTPRA
jgi:hypothetical protein